MKFLVLALVVLACQARGMRAQGFPDAKMRDLRSAAVGDGTPSVVILGKPFAYNLGEPKAIHCEGRNLPEKLKWISPSGEIVKEGSPFLNTRVKIKKLAFSTLEDSVVILMILQLKFEDSGNWTCRAGDLRDSIEVYVGQKVQFADDEVDVKSHEDRMVQLSCEAKGYPEPEVQWLKDNYFIEADRKKILIYKRNNTHILEIRGLDYLDPATYVCRATQDRLSHIAQKKFNLRVEHKPVVELHVVMNETKKLKCSAIGYPPPKFSWSKRIGHTFGEPIVSNDSVYTAPDNTYSTLTLNVEGEEAQGQYKCSVTNNLGSTTILFHVTPVNKPSPPSVAGVKKAEAHNITFNVSCPSCVFKLDDDGIAQRPENLSVIGFTFQLVPCTSGVAVPNWQNAESYPFDVTNASNLEFMVTDLQKSTEYHAQVATRNAAGLSDWLAVHPNPKTTDGSAALITSSSLLIIGFITTFFY